MFSLYVVWYLCVSVRVCCVLAMCGVTIGLLSYLPESDRPHAQHNIPCIDFDPSGNLLASVSIDRTVRLWDLERGELIAQRRIDIHW